MPTAEEINQRERDGHGLDAHDGCNRGVLIEARCKRLGFRSIVQIAKVMDMFILRQKHTLI